MSQLTFYNRFECLAAARWLLLVILVATLVSTAVSEKTTAVSANDDSTYIVLLTDPPLATYAGGIAGLAPTAPSATGAARLDPTGPASVAYLDFLSLQQDQVLAAMSVSLQRPVDPLFHYDAVLNGFAVNLTPDEAAVVAALPGVTRVTPDEIRYLHTDVGPAWIGAAGVWDGSNTGGLPGTKGEGVVVGVIDTGINHDHPAFAAVGPVDEYVHSNPRGQFFGACDPLLGVPFCNNKLIGVYDFTGTGPEDDNGHGSHTASTAAGNVLDAAIIAPTITLNRAISGVAPHANIISYKACVTTPAIGTCLISSLLGAINQATLDQVDVINYSIGGGSSNPWTDLDAQAFFGARSAGIFVATSAGNSGPGPATIGSPADAPWVLSVGASTHNRQYANALVNMSGDNTPTPADMVGKSVTAGYGPAPIVYAGDYGNNLCGSGTAEAPINPFPPGTFSGEIVVCDRGTYARVDKARFVGESGAGGFVLANDAASDNSLVGDAYAIPGVHITYDDGVILKAWLAGGSDHTGTITGTTADESAANGDVMASFSSRGPNPAVADLVKPDVTAPGVDILAAFHTPLGSTGSGPEYGVISGTSMSSPHAAGAAALLRALHPDWTPDEVKSALMTTAFVNLPGSGHEAHAVLKEDGATPADPFDMGSGRVDLNRAARAGLLLDETPANYEAANPDSGGDPKSLNLPSLGNSACDTVCNWTRTVRSTADSSVTWTAVTGTPAGMALTVTPASFTLAPGQSQTISIQANVSELAAGQWQFAQVRLQPDDADIPAARLPLAVMPLGGDAVPQLTLYFHGNSGEHDSGYPGEAECTGDGATDVVVCGGPFLLPGDELSPNPAARWMVAAPLFDGENARNIYDPNWTWYLDEETTLAGPMTVEFWASCGNCSSLLLSIDWTIRLWADEVKVFEQRITATPSLPNVPDRLAVTVDLPEVTAGESFVLHVDPVYIDVAPYTIYYDSSEPCPGAAAGSCDSLVRMPVVGLGNPDPEEPVGGGKVSGGGWLATNDGGKINFGFQAEETEQGSEGELQLRDKNASVNINLEQVTTIGHVQEPCGGISASANAIEFQGSGTFNGGTATFRVCVADNGEPGNQSPNPDRFYLACLSGCGYDTAARASDNGLGGGNIKLHQAPDGSSSSSGQNDGSASVLRLDPLLLAESLIGQVQPLQVRVYDAQGDMLSGETITLVRTAADGSTEHFTAVTGLDGLALFAITILSGEYEYVAYSGDLSSNGMNVKGLLLLP
jgi:subtilisin family serine protease